MIKKLISFLKKEAPEGKSFKKQTFTYFLPSPPARSSGYREKQFDKFFYEFINRGYKILDFKTQASNGGMWIIFLLEATNKASEELDFNDIIAQINDKNSVKSEIEGLYYIDDKAQDL